MVDREKVKKELLELNATAYGLWVHDQKNEFLAQIGNVTDDVIALLKEHEKELLEFIGAVAKLTAENETLKMIYGNPGKIVGELIRCKDCVHKNGLNHCPHNNDIWVADDWFCADGEKRK